MDPALLAQRAAAIRALESASEPLDLLASPAIDAAGRRRALLEASDAIDMALRRWLRDAAAVPAQVRARAQAADKLDEVGVLTELRRHDLLSAEAAEEIRALFEMRRRLGAGATPAAGDQELARRAAHRLDLELRSPPPPDRPQPAPRSGDEGSLVHPVPPPPSPVSRSWLVAGAVALVLLLAAAVAVSVWARPDPRLVEGLALFRSGAYADAASRFWRYAEDHPDDPTPHLYLSRIHRRMGRLDLAGGEVRAALTLAPDDPAVQTELGFVLFATGEHEAAAERFRAVLQVDPAAESAWVGLINSLRASDNRIAASNALERAPPRVRERFARAAASATADTL